MVVSFVSLCWLLSQLFTQVNFSVSYEGKIHEKANAFEM